MYFPARTRIHIEAGDHYLKEGSGGIYAYIYRMNVSLFVVLFVSILFILVYF